MCYKGFDLSQENLTSVLVQVKNVTQDISENEQHQSFDRMEQQGEFSSYFRVVLADLLSHYRRITCDQTADQYRES